MSSSVCFENSPFADELRALARAEAKVPPPANGILFYGSSSIRLWETLAADFAGLPVINHGFGGSTLADCLAEMERLVYPVLPRAIVLYAGDNDLDQGASPERVVHLVEQIIAGIRHRLGAVPVLTLSIKPSPVRFWNAANIRRSNELIAELIAGCPGVHYLDIFAPMLNERSEPRHEMFSDDRLHMNRQGYSLWASLVRERLVNLGLID